MRRIIDKAPLLLCCCMLFSETQSMLLPVLAFLSAIAVSSVSQFAGKSRVSLFAEILYILLCLWNPVFFYFFPVVLYDILSDSRYALCIASGLIFIFSFSRHELWQILLLGGFVMFSVIVQQRTSAAELLEEKLIQTRDSSAELTMLLTEKNKALQENQDNEIHLATLRERNRIAREIHDNVGHLLSRSILQVGALRIIDDENLRKEGLEGLSDTLNNAMTTIRRSVHDLHDDSVDMKQSLRDAVKPLRDNGLTVRAEFDCSENIPNKVKLCIISIVKEGVSNIIRHSSADKASVILREHPVFYQLMIEDNGECSGVSSGNGIGLSNMRDRVENFGGIIKISSGKKGFRIFITLKKEKG